jgi:hypothetical protein
VRDVPSYAAPDSEREREIGFSLVSLKKNVRDVPSYAAPVSV